MAYPLRFRNTGKEPHSLAQIHVVANLCFAQGKKTQLSESGTVRSREAHVAWLQGLAGDQCGTARGAAGDNSCLLIETPTWWSAFSGRCTC